MSENAELKEAVEILSYVQNLDDTEEAQEFARLWIKAVNNGLEAAREPLLDENKIMQHIREVDNRFNEVQA